MRPGPSRAWEIAKPSPSPPSRLVHGTRLKLGRVGAGGVRLGHRKTGANLAIETFLEPAVLLILGAVLGENFHVARVGRHAIEGTRPERAATHQFAQRGIFMVGKSC